MNCQSTSEQPFEELFIQINHDVKSIERGFRDWEGPDMINDYEGRGSAYFHSHTCKFLANIIVSLRLHGNTNLEVMLLFLFLGPMLSTQESGCACIYDCFNLLKLLFYS